MIVEEKEREVIDGDFLKKDGNVRQYSVIKELHDLGRLRIANRSSDERLLESLKRILAAVSDICEGDWDFEYTYSNGFLNLDAVIIYMGDVKINNRTGKQHILKDFFVKIPFYLSSYDRVIKINSIYGGRTTFSTAEIDSSYLHSHISGINIDTNAPFWGNFCLGYGSLAMSLSEVNSESSVEKDPQIYHKLIMEIFGLVAYESLEGGPYREIRNILRRGRSSTPRQYTFTPVLIEEKINSIKAYMEENKINLNFRIHNNKYVLINDTVFKEVLKFLMELLSDREKTGLLVFVTPQGEILPYGSDAQNNPTNYRSMQQKSFLFREERIHVKIHDLESNTQINTNVEYVFHPQFIKLLIQKIEYNVNKKAIRNSTLERYKH